MDINNVSATAKPTIAKIDPNDDSMEMFIERVKLLPCFHYYLMEKVFSIMLNYLLINIEMQNRQIETDFSGHFKFRSIVLMDCNIQIKFKLRFKCC